MGLYAVRQRRGGPWDWTRDLRGQVGFEDHARFVDGLVDAGFIVLGGPLQSEREVLIIVNAPDEDVVRKRFSDDPWVQRDAAALRNTELLPWDCWGAMPEPEDTISSELASLFDRLAALTETPDASHAELDRLCQDYERLRVPPAVRSAARNRYELLCPDQQAQ